MVVEVIRSPRRRKTVSAELKGEKILIRIPAGMSEGEERVWVRRMVERVTSKEQARRRNAARDLELSAERLNQGHFGGTLRWRSIRYVTNQRDRFGSCTPEDGTIRISHRVAELPDWVRDYVVMHELAHLVDASHSSRFWGLVGRYPLTERARGYLMALGAGDPAGQVGSVP